MNTTVRELVEALVMVAGGIAFWWFRRQKK
jgi:hypothetical protein